MTTRARSRSSPSAGVRLRGRGDDRWTRCSELLVSIRKRSTRQPEPSQLGPSDSQRGGRARAHLNTANCRAAARAPSVQTRRFECRPCYFPLFYSDGRTQIALWEKGCYVRGRSSGKTGPPGNGFTPVRGGAKNIRRIGRLVIYYPIGSRVAATTMESRVSIGECVPRQAPSRHGSRFSRHFTLGYPFWHK